MTNHTNPADAKAKEAARVARVNAAIDRINADNAAWRARFAR